MCIAVINELRETQTTFTTRRFFWAQVSRGGILPMPETDDIAVRHWLTYILPHADHGQPL